MNKKNTTTTKAEYLSAFLDDEAGAFEQQRMLDESQKDDELKQKIANFSLIGEAMRNENSPVTVQVDFLAGIHEKLAEEPVYDTVLIDSKVANSSSRVKAWLRPVAGMALAASLAAVTVVALNPGNDANKSTGESTVVAQSEKISTKKSNAVRLAKASTVSLPDKAWRKRLRGYVNSHAKYASTSAIMPSIRAASYASSY